MRYCSRCTYPVVSVNLELDDEGVCSSCRVFEDFESIPQDVWNLRRQKFVSLIREISKAKGANYDCIFLVSGGKDGNY